MSGYSDDYDDRGRDDRDDRGHSDDRAVRTAKSQVMAPAVGLIVIAAFGLLSIVGNLIQLPTLDAQFDEEVKKIEANPNIPNQQKQDQIDLLNKIRDYAKVGMLPYIGVIGLTSIVILVGGLKLMNLSSPGLAMLGSVLSLVPCISGCCFLGFVFGIWAMIAMSRPEVKEGFAAKRRLASGPPDQY